MEKEILSKLEGVNSELEDLKDLVGLMLEECFAFRVDALKQYEIREKYTTAQTMTTAIFNLLYYQIRENNNYISEAYKEKKAMKAGVTNVNNQ